MGSGVSSMKYDGHAEIVLKDVIIDIASSDTTIFERKAFDISSRDTFRSPGGKNEEIELHDDDHVMEIDSGNMTALTTPQGSASSYETSRQSLSPAILNKATEEYQDSDDQRMPSLTGSYYCHICLEWEGTESKGFCLPCGHSFCRACLESFLAANIIDANTSLRCFHPLEPNPSAPSVEASERFGDEEETGSEPQLRVCNAEIDEDTILEILRDKEILHKYTRFKFMKQNPDSRECPKCGEFNTTGSAQKTQLICSNALCLQEFCFLHGDAHPTESCLQYSSRESVDSKASLELIASLAKSCPGCGMSILKSGGCNHMKCPHCRQAFCWLCLQKIEDDLFPAHFQWWNATGTCSNLQMDDSVEPTPFTRHFASALMVIQMIILGPLTLICTGLSLLLCGLCIKKGKFTAFATACLSTWGIIWICLLVFIPIGAAAFGVGAPLLLIPLLIVPFQQLARYILARRRGELMTTTTSSLPFESIRRRNTSVQVETSVVHLSNGTRPQNPVAPPPTNVLAAEDSTGVTSAFDDDDVDIEAQIESHSFNNCSELKNISA